MSSQTLKVDRLARDLLPLTIGSKNAEHALGVPWRWALAHARAWGVPIWKLDGKRVIPAAPMFEAMRAHAESAEPEQQDDEQERESMRTRLGLERRTA